MMLWKKVCRILRGFLSLARIDDETLRRLFAPWFVRSATVFVHN